MWLFGVARAMASEGTRDAGMAMLEGIHRKEGMVCMRPPFGGGALVVVD